MCATCGCSNDSHITMTIPGKETLTYHSHGQGGLHHHHKDHDHPHTHTVHKHVHTDHAHSSEGNLIEVEANILLNNNLVAERNRGYFEALSISALNLVSSPGSGKTTILERTMEGLSSEFDLSVIEGDQQTSNDAERIAKYHVPVIQINTGKMCHLDAQMINEAVKSIQPKQGSLLFIENVGNLVCPAMFDLGEKTRVVIMSVTEGVDKAIKYPEMFHTSDLCIINKTDLIPYVDFDIEAAKAYALRVNHNLKFIEMSATKGEGLETWFSWLKQLIT